MKKTFCLMGLLLALVVSGMVFVSCSDEEWTDDDLANYAQVLWDNRDGNFAILYNGFEFRISKDGTASVSNKDDKRTKAVLPSEIKYKGKSYPVITIDGFYDSKYLTQIVIPEGYREISDACFSGCSRLSQISIPESVNSMGSSTFRNCTSLETVKLPSSLLKIDAFMFEGCSSLNSIKLPPNIKSIGYSAFKDCSKLSSITIPNNVTTIGEYAFYGCI